VLGGRFTRYTTQLPLEIGDGKDHCYRENKMFKREVMQERHNECLFMSSCNTIGPPILWGGQGLQKRVYRNPRKTLVGTAP
jgi:hypothetical protein